MAPIEEPVSHISSIEYLMFWVWLDPDVSQLRRVQPDVLGWITRNVKGPYIYIPLLTMETTTAAVYKLMWLTDQLAVMKSSATITTYKAHLKTELFFAAYDTV